MTTTTVHRVSYQVQTRPADGSNGWRKQFSRMTRDGGAAILRDFGQVASEMPGTVLVRAVEVGLDGEFGNPVRVLAIRTGAGQV